MSEQGGTTRRGFFASLAAAGLAARTAAEGERSVPRDERDNAELAAGRLLIRYGWPLPRETAAILPATEKQSARARAMESPDFQVGALEELEHAAPKRAADLVELCRARRHGDASSFARRCVMTHVQE